MFFFYFCSVENLYINPGDSFDVKCEYQSKLKQQVTFFGDATSDEMCLAFIAYYPFHPQYTMCMSSGNLPMCIGGSERFKFAVPHKCNITLLVAEKFQPFVMKILSHCDPTGVTCKPGCQDEINKFKSADPCFTGDALYVTEFVMQRGNREMVRRFQLAIRSCDTELSAAMKTTSLYWLLTLTLLCMIGFF